MTKLIFTLPAFLAAFMAPLMAIEALANDVGDVPEDPLQKKPLHERFFDDFSRVAIGVAAVSGPEFIGSDKQDFDIFPIIQGQYNFTEKDAIYLRGTKLGYAHAYNPHVQFGFETGARGSRNEDDDARLNGMGDIDTAFEVGPWIKGRFYGFSLKSDLMFDVTGEHSGYIANFRASKRIAELPGPSFDLYAETSWGSGDFMDTYFDVSAAQAIAGRPAFDADAGIFQSAIGVTFQYALSKSVYMRLDGKMSFLNDDARDSSVTYSDENLHGFLALGYAF